MPRKTKFGYELSRPADGDLEEIYDYTFSEYGENQAIKYLTELEEMLHQLVINPEIGRNRDEIRIGLRSISNAEHIVFYRILKTHIRIVRVLHGSRDIPRFF